MHILPEAWPGLFLLGLSGGVLHYTVASSFDLPLLVVFIAYMWLHREVHHDKPVDPLAIVSAVDGRVDSVATVCDPMRQQPGVRISLRKKPWQEFGLRSPTEGKIYSIKLLATATRSVFLSYAVWIKTDENDDVILVVDSVRWMRRPKLYVRQGERVGLGQRFGYVPFGWRFDMYVPANARLCAMTGARANAGSTVLARYTHK